MRALKKPLALAILAYFGIVSFVFGYWHSHGKHFGEYQDEANVFVDVPKVGQRWSTPVKAHSIPKNRTEKNHPFSYGELLLKNSFVQEYKDGQNIKNQRQKSITSWDDLVKNVKENPITITGATGQELVLGEKIPQVEQKYVLVVSNPRSGSTFLGSLLNSYPGTFYSFEPLHYLSDRYCFFYLPAL